MASDPCDETAIAHWQGLYEREKSARWELEKERGEVNAALRAEMALAEEMTNCALKLSVEVSEQKARADAAEADAKHSRLVLATCPREEKSHRDALAAARRECEGLREDIAALLPMAEREHHRDLGKHLDSDISALPEGLRIAREGALLLRLHHPEIACPATRSDANGARTALTRLIAVLDSPFVNVEATKGTAKALTTAMSDARAALAAPAAGPSDSATDALFNALVRSK